MTDYVKTPMVVTNQGAPKFSHSYGYSLKRGDNVVSFWVDLDTKYCEVVATGSDGENEPPMIYVGATENSLYLDESQDADAMTGVAFPEFPGWDVHCCHISKWTLAVCLTAPATVQND